MGDVDKPQAPSLPSRWVLEGGVVIGSPDTQKVQFGESIDFVRRIPFGAHKLSLGQMSLDDHWTLDLGFGAQSLGWSGARPDALSITARSGISYNLLNVVDLGLNLRGGYANVKGDVGNANGFLWSAGFRMMTTVGHVSVFTEGGLFSQPAFPGASRDLGVYGQLGAGYLFY